MIGADASARAERIAGVLSCERALLVTVADRIARAPSLSAKMFLCRWVGDGARRIRAVRRALPADAVDRATGLQPHATVRELACALTAMPSADAFLLALCGAIATMVARTYATIAELSPDDPTSATMRNAERYHRSARRAVRSVLHAPSGDAESGANDLARLAAGAVLRAGDVIPTDPLVRSSAELDAPARERAIRALREGEAREDVWFVTSPVEYERYLHQLIAFEINTFEAVSRHIAEFASMPWEFHWDMACQIRDEVAHLEMWLERLARANGRLGRDPLSTHEFAVCRRHALPGRLALLERVIEASALDALALSRCFWETRRDPVMVGYIDRVQSDEIRHVRHGNKWLRRLCHDDQELLSLVERSEGESRERMVRIACELESAGVVACGNAELVRRKFDDPLAFEVNAAAWSRAGFSAGEIAYEVERRRRALRRETQQGGVVQ